MFYLSVPRAPLAAAWAHACCLPPTRAIGSRLRLTRIRARPTLVATLAGAWLLTNTGSGLFLPNGLNPLSRSHRTLQERQGEPNQMRKVGQAR
jgi:hypothetical protein